MLVAKSSACLLPKTLYSYLPKTLYSYLPITDAKAQFNTLGKSAARKSNSTPKDNSGVAVKGEQASDTLQKGGQGNLEIPRLHAPLRSLIITSEAGWRMHPLSGKWTNHHGIDLRAYFEPVFAVMDGLVEKAGYDERSGFYIRLNHSPFITSSYAHLSDIKVREGATIKAGDIIGISGNSGTSTGPHLHFKIRYSGDTAML
jgi:murein DD-endopeptidase MepM/ murein hydrolase activator NlpD